MRLTVLGRSTPDQDRSILTRESVLLKVYRARGALIRGLGTCRGQRNDLGLAPLPRGGCREKKNEMEIQWKHADAESAMQEVFRPHD